MSTNNHHMSCESELEHQWHRLLEKAFWHRQAHEHVGQFEAEALAFPASEKFGGKYVPSPLDDRPFGIDVSRFNPVTWRSVFSFPAPRVQFAYIRTGQAHEGAYDWVDNRFFYNWFEAWAALEAAGLESEINIAPPGEPPKFIDAIMPYHVFYPASPIPPQVTNLVRLLRFAGHVKHGPVIIDWELAQGVYGAQQTIRMGEMLYRTEQALGVPAAGYTGPWFLQKYNIPPPLPPNNWYETQLFALAQYGYGGEPSTPLVIPNGMPPEQVFIHQTMSVVQGNVFGAPWDYSVDGNRGRWG